MTTCPITKRACALIPQCVLLDQTGATYCVEWVKKHRRVGVAIQVDQDNQVEGWITIYEEIEGDKTFYFIYNKKDDKVREFSEKQFAINWCVERRLKFTFKPMSL